MTRKWKLFGESSNRELFLPAQRISFAQALKLLIEPFDETARGKNSYNRYVRNYNAETATEKASLYNSLHTRIPSIKTAITDAAPNSIIGYIQIGVGDYI